ncbi:MAG: hypothetical protein ACKV2Q_04845 [Planctomycetaceae bacterium]
MSDFNEIVKAAVCRDNLWLRGAVQEFIRLRPCLVDVGKPDTDNEFELVVAAGIMELLAIRISQVAPSWTAEVGGLSEPFFLVTAAERMPYTRHLCEQESPEPLRKRNLLAPPQFLTWA